ncbi:hypothetical protein GIB67_040794 [Kingdonia uniflora]|uniref:Ribonuclease H2 subunit B n=1 Tax=Kingdonia uniflora TaxID=39325 RepID=A0A7J7P4F3_9MAGN|nr:hypothetical protein GIB67_040794 [Kingdonia uniflora]
MASSPTEDEIRLIIAPISTSTTNEQGLFLSLRHPKSGNPTCYLLNNGYLQELHWFKQSYGSWFLGDYVSEDGSLYVATPVDPVFILLPIFDKARMKKDGDKGKFRQLDEIMFINDYPGYQNILPLAQLCMEIVCEVKEIESVKFFRLDESKVLAWLCHKVQQLKLTLPTLDQNYAAQDEKGILTEVLSLLGEYLNSDPWLKLLCTHLKFDLQETTRKPPVHEFFPSALESTPGSSHSLQAKNGNNKKTSSNGKQVKKMKAETDSRNIKDMFSMALRKRK